MSLGLGLVAYGSSDDDEESPPEDEILSRSSEDKPKETSEDDHISINVTDNINLFGALPKPVKKKVIHEEDDEFLKKKEATLKPKAQITVPSISDFKDVDSGPKIKKPTGSGKKSGLLSILPEPKFSRTSSIKPAKPLIPQAVERKTLNIAPNPASSTAAKITLNTANSLLSTEYSDSDDDESTVQDFFSINSQPDIIPNEHINIPKPPIEIPLYPNLASKRTATEAYENGTTAYDDIACSSSIQSSEGIEYQPDLYSHQVQSSGQGHSSHEVELDDEAIRQLCGSRKRHKKEDIQVITVDQKQVLSDSREWLVKGLMDDTSKRVSASKKKGNEPTTQQKRKHQITYLAHQAKANEVELQNQWANNRISRRQTQSKYGF